MQTVRQSKDTARHNTYVYRLLREIAELRVVLKDVIQQRDALEERITFLLRDISVNEAYKGKKRANANGS